MKKYLTRLAAALLALILLVTPSFALTVDEALELLEDYYYGEIPEEAYEAQSVEELVGLLDPYTEYMDPERYAWFLGNLEGEVSTVGIGVVIQYTEQGFLVDEVLSGGGAQDAGLRAGDLIVEIDGVSCVPAGVQDRDRLLGGEGTQVTISVLRDGVTTRYTVTRRPVTVAVANTRAEVLDNGFGYIKCDTFGGNTGELFTQELEELDSQVKGWIVDLRGNGGGYTDAAVEMLDALNGPERYLYFEDGQGGVAVEDGTGEAVTRKPVMVLTNAGSASASELLAAGVRDVGRGVIIGSRTYGKGVAQTILDEEVFPDYFDGDGLKITFARFYSGGANTTDKVGVIPTLLVNDADTEAVVLALCGEEKNAPVGILLGSSAFYVDPDTDSETMAALFAALPPQASVFFNNGHTFNEMPISEVAEKLGLEYESRWFDDVEDSEYARAINAMGTSRLLSGDGAGGFDPDGQLTRAQLCMMLSRVLNVEYFGANQFSDVPEGIWYAEAVNAIASLGLVEGMPDGSFDPNGVLTQEQFLAVMGRMARFLNLMIDHYGEIAETNQANLVIAQERDIAKFSKWAWSSVTALAWGVEEALGESGDLLYAPLSEIDPKAGVLREEAAAGMYAVLQGLGYLL